MLESLGVQVIPAVDGQEAVERFQESPVESVDAILMDMQMPRLDGCGAARAIRALDRPDAKTVPHRGRDRQRLQRGRGSHRGGGDERPRYQTH